MGRSKELPDYCPVLRRLGCWYPRNIPREFFPMTNVHCSYRRHCCGRNNDTLHIYIRRCHDVETRASVLTGVLLFVARKCKLRLSSRLAGTTGINQFLRTLVQFNAISMSLIHVKCASCAINLLIYVTLLRAALTIADL